MFVVPSSPRRAVGRPARALADVPKPTKRRPRLRRFVAAVCCLVCVSPALIPIPASVAAPVSAVQNVSVQVGPDGSVTALSSLVASRDQSGVVTGSAVQLDPLTYAQQLPVRVTTAWWMGGQTGSDLSQLAGRSGRVAIEVNVLNLTLRPQELSVDYGGAKYRRYALIGVPLTVVASAQLPDNAIGSVITTKDSTVGNDATNGVASQSESGQTIVQWAAMLAPPLLPSSTSFRLVMDVTNFTPPNFDITVQPGLLTDPSIQQILSASTGLDSSTAKREQSTLEVIMNVASELQQGEDLIAQVYEALSQDISQVGRQTYSELQSSSAAVLSQIEATKSRLSTLGSQAQSQTASAQNSINADLRALLARLNTDVLGSTTEDLQLSATAVDGCNIELPSLPTDAPRTLASAVRLVQAQLQTVVNAFGDQVSTNTSGEDPDTAVTPNCRSTMLEHLTASIGAPETVCSSGDSSVRCAIAEARSNLLSNRLRLSALETGLNTQISDLGVSDLSASVSALGNDMTTIKTDLATLAADLSQGRTTTTDLITVLLSQTIPSATTTIVSIRGQLMSLTASPGGQTSLASVQTSLNTLANDSGNLQTKVDTQINAVRSIGDHSSKISAILGSGDSTTLGLLDQVDSLLNTSGSTTLPAGWQDQLTTIVDNAINSDPLCPSNWTDIASPTSDADADYATALSTLAADSDCPASALAGVLAPMVSAAIAHNDLQTISNGLSSIDHENNQITDLVSGAQTGLIENLTAVSSDLGDLKDSLDSHATSLGSIRQELNQVIPLLDSLWLSDPNSNPQATGQLADIADGLRQIKTLIDQSDFLSANQLADSLVQQLSQAYSQSVTTNAQCPLPAAARPVGSVDAVIWASNHLTCQQQGINTFLSNWFHKANIVYDDADTDLQTAMRSSDDALTRALADIGTMSDGLVNELSTKTTTITTENLAAIDKAISENEAELAAITQSFTTSTNSIVSSLVSQLDAANLDADSAKSRLQQDFNTLLASLGSPDQSSRVGLLGRLRSTATSTGNTVNILETVKQTTSAQGSYLSAQLLALKLETAQFQAAQTRLSDLPRFPGAPVDIEVATAYSIHVRGR